MFRRWLERRETKRIQEQCPHEYSVTVKYDREEWNGKYHSKTNVYDLYCPICDKEIYKVSKVGKLRILNRQELRRRSP